LGIVDHMFYNDAKYRAAVYLKVGDVSNMTRRISDDFDDYENY